MLVSALAGTPISTPAQVTLANGGFELDAAGDPLGWRSNPQPGYTVHLDSLVVRSGRRALRLEGSGEFVPVTQFLDAAPLRGKLIRFRAYLRTDLVDAHSAGQLWVRVDRPDGKRGFFDNMDDRPVRGRSEWAAYEIVAEIEPDADRVLVGGFLRGTGRIWLDDANVEVLSDTAGASPGSALAPEAEQYLLDALRVMQARALRRDSVDWASLRRRAFWYAAGARTPAETHRAIAYVLRALNDNHSHFMPPATSVVWQTQGAAGNPKPVVRRSGDIGYVMLPGYSGGDPAGQALYATQLHRALARVDTAPICAWIVDLRENTGGNMWPMLAGIGPVLGDGDAGRMRSGGAPVPWSYSAGEAKFGPWVLVGVRDGVYRPAGPDRPVAVLTGGRTASSGEAIAVSFRGRAETRSFGQPTAGLSTGNEVVSLRDGARLFLTTAVFADRLGVSYGGPIPPDVVIAPSAAGDTNEDPVQASAVAWLRAHPSCAVPTVAR